jgi:hypothetical protein
MAEVLDRPSSGQDEFELERATYLANKRRLLAGSAGMYVLIKGDTVVGVFGTWDEAIERGYELFPGQAIYTRQIEAVETPSYFYGFQGKTL